jgi:hypothetical protein
MRTHVRTPSGWLRGVVGDGRGEGNRQTRLAHPLLDPLAPVGVDLARQVDVPGALGHLAGMLARRLIHPLGSEAIRQRRQQKRPDPDPKREAGNCGKDRENPTGDLPVMG